MAHEHVHSIDDEPEEALVDETTVRSGPGALLVGLAWLVGLAGIITVALLAFRLGFEMGDANATNDTVDFVYDVTGPLVQPFQGIADANTLDNGGIFYPETAIAMGVYLLATALLMTTLYAWANFFGDSYERSVSHRRHAVQSH